MVKRSTLMRIFVVVGALVALHVLAPRALGLTCSCSGGSITCSNQSILATDPDGGARCNFDGTVSSCGSEGACGTPVTGIFRYKAYSFTNTRGSTTCFTVTVTNNNCSISLGSVTYSPSYVPGSGTVSTNYLAKNGNSITSGTSRSYSFNLANNTAAQILVFNRNTNTTCSANQTYTLNLSPCTASSSSGTVTAVGLDSATGTRDADGRVLLQWRTGFEVDNLGFNIYRE